MGADWRPRRARAPCLENKNSAPQARFRSQTPSKQAKVHAFWLPKQQCNQPQPPQPPHWSTRPTGPVDHPADPPTHRAPHPHPTLALGLRTLGAPGPPQGPLFSVFVLPCSLTASDTPGRPLTERSKTLGQATSPEPPKAPRRQSTHRNPHEPIKVPPGPPRLARQLTQGPGRDRAATQQLQTRFWPIVGDTALPTTIVGQSALSAKN